MSTQPTAVDREPGVVTGPVPPCKGCGSTNLRADSAVTIVDLYLDALGVDDFGNLIFGFCAAASQPDEKWAISCDDCGRGMRTKLAPVPERS